MEKLQNVLTPNGKVAHFYHSGGTDGKNHWALKKWGIYNDVAGITRPGGLNVAKSKS
ncbi:MAG: hypothetical protein ACLSHN_11115 [Eubacterium sp.]|uniref:hypothetical protein n=1 Tax=Eubacterium sp. TaxID=142586 RepID=UPI0039953C91